MAVVPMQKIRLVVHETDVDAALDVVQQNGALEFQPTNTDEIEAPVDIVFPHALFLPRVQHVVNFLEPYAPTVSTWKKLCNGVDTSLSEAEILKLTEETDAASSVVEDVEKLQVEFAECNEKLRTLEEIHTVLDNWKPFDVSFEHLSTKHTVTRLVERMAVTEHGALSASLDAVLAEQEIRHILSEVSDSRVAVTVLNNKEAIAEVDQLIESTGAVIVPTPEVKETAEIELVAVAEKLAALKGDLALLHDQAEHIAISHYNQLRLVAEALTWQRDRYSVIDNALATKHTVVLDGWMDATKKTAIEDIFREKNIAVNLLDLEPNEDEEPPVEIKNSPFIQPFEAVTRLYGMPGYKDLDPTVFLAGFFFLFFGMSLTDVGYGVFLMIAASVVLIFFKVAPTVQMFAKLLLFAGFATVLVGLLFGGYLGIDPQHLPEFLKRFQIYDPIGNPLPVFYTALGLGVFQVMVGMLIKIYSDSRNGKLLDGILDQGPWLFVFVLGILYVAVVTGYVDIITTSQIVNLIYVGVIMIMLASGRKGETVVGKIRSAALSLYDSIGYFSDILSYSRLLALGLATTALAFAVNLIAGMISEVPFVGGILAIVILVIGHVFTLAVNTLGAFIHSARLQFVEFFGKFISGTGKSFAPLTRTKKYIAVRDD